MAFSYLIVFIVFVFFLSFQTACISLPSQVAGDIEIRPSLLDDCQCEQFITITKILKETKGRLSECKDIIHCCV